MNNEDANNLDFLLSVSDEVLRDWYDQASEDDIEYACELLQAYEDELDNVGFMSTRTLQ